MPQCAPDSDDLLELVFIKRHILILLLCSLLFRHPFVSILSCGQIYTDIQRLSEFAFFSRNKNDEKDTIFTRV